MEISVSLFLGAVAPALGERGSAGSLGASVFPASEGQFVLQTRISAGSEKSHRFSVCSALLLGWAGTGDSQALYILVRKPEARDSLRVTERDFFLFGYVFFLTDHKDQLRKEGANRFHSPGEHLVLCRGGRGCRWLHLSWQPGSKGTGTPIHSRQLSEVSRQSKVTRPERGKAGSRTRLQCRGPSHESTSPALLVLSLAEMLLNASDVHLARCSSQPNQQVVRCRVSQRHLRDEAKTWSGTGVSPWARAGKLPGRGAP